MVTLTLPLLYPVELTSRRLAGAGGAPGSASIGEGQHVSPGAQGGCSPGQQHTPGTGLEHGQLQRSLGSRPLHGMGGWLGALGGVGCPPLPPPMQMLVVETTGGMFEQAWPVSSYDKQRGPCDLGARGVLSRETPPAFLHPREDSPLEERKCLLGAVKPRVPCTLMAATRNWYHLLGRRSASCTLSSVVCRDRQTPELPCTLPPCES